VLRPRPTLPPSRPQTPPRHAGPSAARAGTSTACADSSVDRPAAGASALALGACSSVASAALGEGGAGSHLSRGAWPPSLFSSSFSSDNESSDVAGGKPLLLAQLEFFVPLLPELPPSDPPLLLTRRPLLFPPLRRMRALGLGAWAGRTALHSQPPSAKEDEMSKSRRRMEKE
jgi:hypothetical protein